MQKLRNDFNQDRSALIEYVSQLAPWAKGKASPIRGIFSQAEQLLENIDPINYGNTRNYADGKITRLSPYISHGMISLNKIRSAALKQTQQAEQITKFIQELAWRAFWQFVAKNHPDYLWQNAEDYKTGFIAAEYADTLPQDILDAETDIACINAFIRQLYETGYLHNHARMYLASYVIHFRRIKWQAGAKWFLSHLLDGEIASNNLSWQWVASCFGNKAYIFNLENVQKYFSGHVNTDPQDNKPLNFSYEALNAQLFPRRPTS